MTYPYPALVGERFGGAGSYGRCDWPETPALKSLLGLCRMLGLHYSVRPAVHGKWTVELALLSSPERPRFADAPGPPMSAAVVGVDPESEKIEYAIMQVISMLNPFPVRHTVPRPGP